jgi:hypothetical protein
MTEGPTSTEAVAATLGACLGHDIPVLTGGEVESRTDSAPTAPISAPIPAGAIIAYGTGTTILWDTRDDTRGPWCE